MQEDVSIKIILYLCQSSPAGASLQLVPMIMELVASIKNQKRYLNSTHELQARPAAL